MRQCGEIINDFGGSNNGGQLNPHGHSQAQDEDGNFTEPQVGMEFDSEDAARILYEEYARQMGFRVRVKLNPSRANGMATSREFLCSRERLKKRAAGTCEAMLKIEVAGQNKWVVTKFVKEHTHAILSHNKVQQTKHKRHFAALNNNAPEASRCTDFIRSGMMYVSLNGNGIPAEGNRVGSNMSVSGLNNMVTGIGLSGFSNRRRTLGKDAQNLLDYLKKMQAENPGFYYAIQLDEENRMANAFWVDARSRIAYSHFGDAVILETSYRVNQCIVPFAPFTGVNHHGQLILFGCALLVDESQATFVWLFRTFLAAMNDQAPVSLTTENHKAIKAAVAQVFPVTRHCVNKWYVLREGQERMAQVCLSHPNFQVDLYNCINMTDTIEEFELCWNSLIFKYGLKRNDWLQSIYDARQQWVPVYFRDTFFAAFFPGIGFENSFFDGYVNQQTMLPMFFRQYERALENSFDTEVEADFETTCTTPLLRTPSPMEKQAASVYTKRIFSKFQDELVETFVFTATRVDGDEYDSTYRVAKFEDDQKSYFVTLNIAEMKANCSCKMFEYCGILCRHVLTAFTVTNILTLPSHYILKRWTRNAKSMVVADENELTRPKCLTTRFNNLCMEAIRFAEESAISSETYCAALASLREGLKKVASVKKSVAKVANSSSRVSGGVYDDQRTGNGLPEMTPSLWPRQDEIIQRFNLNDAGVPCQPITDPIPNVSCLAPVSLNHLGAHSDNMVVLPCLKSMTWMMENKNSTPANKVAVINLKLQDYGRIPAAESELKFSLSKVTLEPMLRSMAYISEHLSTPANKVAVINLKLQDTETTTGESEVKFQVSRDTLGAMLRSMAYIREQLSNTTDSEEEHSSKRPRK